MSDRCIICQSWSYASVSRFMWMLGTERGSSARSASVHLTSEPSPQLCIKFLI